MDLSRVKLTPYGNRAGDSGVLAYALGPGWIVVQFRRGECYLYDRTCPGPHDVAALQRLAIAGRGLSTFICTHIRDHHARKLQPRVSAGRRCHPREDHRSS